MQFIAFSSRELYIPQSFYDYFSIKINNKFKFNQTNSNGDYFFNSSIGLAQNKFKVSFALDEAAADSLQLEQTSSDIVLNAKNSIAGKIGDGIFAVSTNLISENSAHDLTSFNFPWGIKTADCLPVAIVYHIKNKSGAALVHAGWKGFVAGIHLHALKQMIAALGDPALTFTDFCANLEVTIGPAIFGANYPCGKEVYEKIKNHFIDNDLLPQVNSRDSVIFNECLDIKTAQVMNDQRLTPIESDKFYPDLQLLMCLALTKIGVDPAKITVARENTWGSSFLYSYRYACKTGLETGGRLVTRLSS